jgi:hypothetical protein
MTARKSSALARSDALCTSAWVSVFLQFGTPAQAASFFFFFLIPFYLQAVQIHSANGVKLLEA